MFPKSIPTTLFLSLVMVFSLTNCNKNTDQEKDSKKTKEEKKQPPLKMVSTKIESLGVSMMAPQGAKIKGDKRVTVSKGKVFGVVLTKDIFGVKGDTLIIPFEKKLLVKKLVDKPHLQVWTKEMGDETVVLFAMAVKAGDKKLYVQSNGLGLYNKAQIDTMIKAVKTIKPLKQ